MNRRFLTITALIASLTLVGAGCGTSTEKTGEPKDEDQKQERPTTETTTENEPAPPKDGRTASGDLVQRGENLTLPPDFPSEIPIYPGSSVNAVTLVTAVDAASVLLTTMTPIDAVVVWYDQQTTSMWTTRTATTATDKVMRVYEKPGFTLNVTIERKDGLTNITALRIKKQ